MSAQNLFPLLLLLVNWYLEAKQESYKTTVDTMNSQPDINYYNTVCEIWNAIVQDYTYKGAFS